ncbi:Archaeal putative transposase ISC1217 [Metallosphaera yellowstonensis MK1]|uniref:Archaeal putative transposase ISC1217 n=1 Tax=Metallosphaera yellowstonensis MK1 TaxID=671065 RepID=H2C0S6_9CREN|nr:transposase [Metallosphaera yellowstonensis]EHP71189.1 Archaeal putative transposase ISC1217 [Metallosphaera yellowstonensis MK1]
MRPVREINRLGVVRRNGRSRKVGLTLVLMVLVGGRASVRNAAETFGLDYANLLGALGELDDAWRDWRSCQTGQGTSRHHRRHRGPQRSRGTLAPENYWIYCHAHGRFERAKLLTLVIVDLSTGRTFTVSPTP